jgi:hypothetical protein
MDNAAIVIELTDKSQGMERLMSCHPYLRVVVKESSRGFQPTEPRA